MKKAIKVNGCFHLEADPDDSLVASARSSSETDATSLLEKNPGVEKLVPILQHLLVRLKYLEECSN